jgi:hypothetical protein
LRGPFLREVGLPTLDREVVDGLADLVPPGDGLQVRADQVTVGADNDLALARQAVVENIMNHWEALLEETPKDDSRHRLVEYVFDQLTGDRAELFKQVLMGEIVGVDESTIEHGSWRHDTRHRIDRVGRVMRLPNGDEIVFQNGNRSERVYK